MSCGRHCPHDDGPATAIHHRFDRGRRRGLWTRIFAALSAQSALPGESSIDSTAMRDSRSAQGKKGGAQVRAIRGPAGDCPQSPRGALAWRSDHENPRPGRWLRADGDCSPQPLTLRRHPGGPALLDKTPGPTRLLVGKGYDANGLRRRRAATKTKAVIPSTRSWKSLIAMMATLMSPETSSPPLQSPQAFSGGPK
jgi:hypothetical protein